MRIAVAGGTGTVGSLVVQELEARGHEAVPLARARGVDVATGAGLPAALAGVEVVVDALNVVTSSGRAAGRFFATTTRQLLQSGAAAGVRHHVVLSIVGVDRSRLGYYRAKAAQERQALAGPLPVTVLRTTQWHEFPGQLLERVPGPVALVPRVRVATVAAAEVARALADIASGEPLGRAPDLAGPEVHDLPDLARRVLAARGARRPVLALPVPGRDALLPDAHARRGTTPFATWLAGAR